MNSEFSEIGGRGDEVNVLLNVVRDRIRSCADFGNSAVGVAQEGGVEESIGLSDGCCKVDPAIVR